jgi:hypothetical protein
VYSGRSANLIYQKLNGDALEASPNRIDLRRHWLDLLSLGMGALPAQFRASKSGRPAWSRALYLARPVMAAEGRELKDTLTRTDQLVRANLLMMTPGQVGVSWVNALTGIVLTVIGGGLGFLAASGLLHLAQGKPVGTALVIAAGALIASIFILAAAAVGSLNAAAYHTCLYIWSLRVEQNRTSGHPAYAAPPEPLASTLAGIASLSAPIYSD